MAHWLYTLFRVRVTILGTLAVQWSPVAFQIPQWQASAKVDHSTLDLFWDGIDAPFADENAHSSLVDNPEHEKLSLTSIAQPTWRLKIMGPADSGTNLARALLLDNLQLAFKDTEYAIAKQCTCYLPPITSEGEKLAARCGKGGHPFACDDTWYGSGIHKHMVPDGASMDKLMAEPNTIVVAMVRSPLSLIASWLKAPYYLGKCMASNFGLSGSSCKVDEFNVHDSRNAVGVYRAYLNGFRKYLNQSSGATLLLTPYEQVVIDPRQLVLSVMKAMGVEEMMPEDITIERTPAKEHGNATGRKAAIEKIKGREYLDELSLVSPTIDLASAYCQLLREEFPNLAECEECVIPSGRTYGADCSKS